MKPKHYFKKLNLILISVVVLTLSSACHKEGIGGKSNVDGKVMHHEKPIGNAIVYIKYGVTEFPGTDVANYDDHTSCDANAKYEFTNLRKGDYYLYAVGLDDEILSQVSGGIAIKLKYNRDIGTDVPVTE